MKKNLTKSKTKHGGWKTYSSLKLTSTYQNAVDNYIESCSDIFSESQIENVQRRCNLFLKYLQSRNINSFNEITYVDIQDYHYNELSHLKEISRSIEESSIHQMLQYLYKRGILKNWFHVYMYYLGTNRLLLADTFNIDEMLIFEEYRYKSSDIDANLFYKDGLRLLELMNDAGYVKAVIRNSLSIVEYFSMFMDLNEIKFTYELGAFWVKCLSERNIFGDSFSKQANRIFYLVDTLNKFGTADLKKIRKKGIRGLKEIPEWCKDPLLSFAEQRKKEKLDDDTVDNDIYSILRFYRYIIKHECLSFRDVTPQLIMDFNLEDTHGSAQGKNACNARIRRFLKYLYRNQYILDQSLHFSLGYTAVDKTTIVEVLSEQDIIEIREHIEDATTPLALRDNAVILLGTEMGIRGCDIVKLELSDIDWKNQTISVLQDKTEVEICLPMPVSVGNTLFKYLENGRPEVNDNHVFLSINAPYKPITRHICYGVMKRVLPARNVFGSGFHVTRKTFSTAKLRAGISPEMISVIIGHRSKQSLTPYLALDSDRMSMCSISLSDMSILPEGVLV